MRKGASPGRGEAIVRHRSRREVVAQMLDYAANAVKYWPAASLQGALAATAMSKGQTPDELSTSSPPTWITKGSGSRRGESQGWTYPHDLRGGPPQDELVRIIEFLNEQMSPRPRCLVSSCASTRMEITSRTSRAWSGGRAMPSRRRSVSAPALSGIARRSLLPQTHDAHRPRSCSSTVCSTTLIGAVRRWPGEGHNSKRVRAVHA